MNILEMKAHPLAAEMPKLAKHELRALEESMKLQGFDKRFPVVVWFDPKLNEERILDGVNRRDVAKKLGLDQVPFTRYDGTYEDAVNFVASRQLGRRSPTSSQRASIMAVHRKRLKECGKVINLEDAAEQAGVSLSQMEKASAVANKSKKVIQKAIEGKLTVTKAANQLKRIMPEEFTPGDPWDEIQKTTDKLTAAEEKLVEWANEYLDPVLDRRGAEMLRANLVSRGRMVAGKRVLGLAMIEEIVQTIRRNKMKGPCPTCKGAGCSDCGNRRYITAHELAQTKNAERNGKK